MLTKTVKPSRIRKTASITTDTPELMTPDRHHARFRKDFYFILQTTMYQHRILTGVTFIDISMWQI